MTQIQNSFCSMKVVFNEDSLVVSTIDDNYVEHNIYLDDKKEIYPLTVLIDKNEIVVGKELEMISNGMKLEGFFKEFLSNPSEMKEYPIQYQNILYLRHFLIQEQRYLLYFHSINFQN